ncbi:N-acetylated-alpha-linked acidic dipeptidase-like protein [Aaosphaeria arxii CBS 175.79]|uniref:N-acetylated-alpha-linked acidic dipeptidase-like protein n=1 Tax=Aaosphaeria arxii CBS 175.79 TaxID=1450172 RepID=A0A6A5XC51_9PLEO|nr:N-acetylated-alpha-linked acidic dipeptidase-like protein [Aaosphaeria arxii CBS 175.79]KAF2010572.1 N-acetylated-alpha-linked acidic dipeptidase-like protein [Aaosphaeria arxii CBS 175.79]
MTNERTPLIAVVHTRPARDRYPHHTLRYICTILLSGVLFLGIGAVILVLTVFTPNKEEKEVQAPWHAYLPGASHDIPASWPKSSGLGYKDLQSILVNTPDAKKTREWSKYYTSGPHLAGKNLSQAVWTKELWQEFGVENTLINSYDIYANYPKGHRLALLEKTTQKGDEDTHSDGKTSWKIKYEAELEEDVLEEDSTSGLADRIPTFHGYSASGNVTAPYIFVNYGTYQDFEDLANRNVSVKGKIVLAKYGAVFRGLKVKRAQEYGAIGAILYSDPGDDGEITELNGYAPYPEGPARNPSSVQRGSCQFLSFAPGDPTTPGYPSLPGAPRQPVDHAIPSIPSIPISYKDALPLLKALNGHGPKASSFGKGWNTGGLGYKGVKYNIGPSPDDLLLNLVNEQEYVTTPMWNVIGVINGSIPDEVVILGNHRDAWIAGGAGDPNSGSAVLNEVIRGFGKALQSGWKPLRTIVFASWDGEEYGLLGSTEWVEEYVPWLKASTIAYLNVDVAASGPELEVSAAPLLKKVIYETVDLVQSPNQTVSNQTVGDVWDRFIAPMGSGSDFTAFQDFAGIASFSLGFGPGGNSSIYHYHSNYDSFDWMEKFGDPDFSYHVATAQIWGLAALNLIETPLIQLNATDYATTLEHYVHSVKQTAEDNGLSTDTVNDLFIPIDKAIERFQIAGQAHDAVAAALHQQLDDNDIPWWKWWEKVKLYYAIRQVNSKYKLLEREFLYDKGLDGRTWFKHVVFAPGKWTGYAGIPFPGIVEAIEEKNEVAQIKWIGIATERIEGAAATLE